MPNAAPLRPGFGGVLLILLPVAVLSGAGFWALQRDRSSAEQEARQRAAELTTDLSSRLGRALASELDRIEQVGGLWEADGHPEPEEIRKAGDSSATGQERDRYLSTLGAWRRDYPLNPPDVLPVVLEFSADGTLRRPPDFAAVPRPPAWFIGLTPEAVELWDALQSALDTDGPAMEIERRLAAFLAAAPEPEPAAFGRFLALQRDLPGRAAGDRRERFSDLAQEQLDAATESEAGVPLSALAFAEFARLDVTNEAPANFLAQLRDQVLLRPSVLTASFLEEAARRPSLQSAESRGAIAELQSRWRSAERRRELAQRLRERSSLSVGSLTNLWFRDARGAAWFAFIQPAVRTTLSSSNGVVITSTNLLTEARVFSSESLALATLQAVRSSAVGAVPRLPAGTRLAFTLDGERLGLPASWASPIAGDPVPVLAESSGSLRLGTRTLPDFGAAGSPDLRPEVESLAGRAPFTVAVELVEPAMLYASARRRQWVFGGLLVATAAIAGLGVWQLHTAYRRQFALTEQKSNFVSSVSHELRTPIASVRLLAEGLARGAVTDEARRREYFDLIVRESRRLSALIDNVLDFARIEQSRRQYEFIPTDLPRLVAETVELVRPLASDRSVAIAVDLAPEAVRLEPVLDGSAIQQALLNLLDNALKHSPSGSEILVRLALCADREKRPLRLAVSDHGPGIPEAEQERIFERFYRRGSELRRETQGVGLGLTIVRHIVEAHGGLVQVESRLGDGATFTLELPVTPPQA